MSVYDLTNIKKHLCAGVLATAVSASPVVFAGSYEDQDLAAMLEALDARVSELEAKPTVESGNDKVALKLSGHVNRAVLWAENGDDSELFHVDNDASSTRFRLEGEAGFNDKINVGAVVELQVESNSTAVIAFNSGSKTQGLTERKLEIYVDHADLGRVWVGQGDMASFLTGAYDLSNTWLGISSYTASLAGGLAFEDGETTGPTVGATFSNYDISGRDDRLRYDTPNFYGATLSAAVATGGDYDFGLTYSRAFNDIKVAGGIGYANLHRSSSGVGDRLDIITSSLSVLLPNGLNFTVSYGQREFDTSLKNANRETSHSYYGKVGYMLPIFPIGITAFGVDYQYVDDAVLEGDESRTFGVGVVQNIDSIASEAYVAYRNYDYDTSAPQSYDDVNAVIAGARVKF